MVEHDFTEQDKYFEMIEDSKRQIRQLKKQITINNKELDRFKPLKDKKMKEVIKITKIIQRLEKQNKKNNKAIQQLTEQIQHPKPTEIPFDDELMQNMETTDILVTDIHHKPQENHFHNTVTINLKDLKYNPTKEKRKYSYAKLENIRRDIYDGT